MSGTASKISGEREKLLLRVARSVRENPRTRHLTVEAFKRLQRLGISVSPNHFYWPVPDIGRLQKREWSRSNLPGLDLRIDQHLDFLRGIAPPYIAECNFPESPNGTRAYHYNNGFFEVVDAEMAYSIVRHYKPERIIEIGSGFSSLILLEALKVNREKDGKPGKLITIDPDESKLAGNHLGDGVRIVTKPAQELDLGFFDELRENDILFLDSSHVVGVGSDVVYEYLEIVPRLHPGVLVHAHDIFLPADYPRQAVLENLCFWSEQYLLQAFLAFNRDFKILWGSSAMQMFHREVLEQNFPRWKTSYTTMPASARRYLPSIDQQRVWPSSFWFQRV